MEALPLLLSGVMFAGLSPVSQHPVAPKDGFVVANGIRFHYREWGHADRPVLIVLHGLTGHAWEFDALARAMADTYRVIVLNQRGHGATGWGAPYSPEIMRDDLVVLFDALGIRRAHVFGHSMGGVNAWWLASSHADRVDRLVIVDVEPTVITSPSAVEGWTSALEAYAEASFASRNDAVAAYLDDYAGSQREALREFVLQNIRQNDEGRWIWRFDARGLQSWMGAAAASGDGHWRALRSVTTPTLLVRAGDSPFTSPGAFARMAAELPDARVVEVAGAGHDVHIDRLDALVAAVTSFLEGR